MYYKSFFRVQKDIFRINYKNDFNLRIDLKKN